MRQPEQAGLKKQQDINNIEKEKAKAKAKDRGKDRNGKDRGKSPNGKGPWRDPEVCAYCKTKCGRWARDCEKRKADVAAGRIPDTSGKGKEPTWKGKPGVFNKDAAVNTLEKPAGSTTVSLG